MAILTTLGWLTAVLLLALISIAFGARLLKWIGTNVANVLERALLSAGISFAILQLAVFALLAEGWLQRRSLGILFLLDDDFRWSRMENNSRTFPRGAGIFCRVEKIPVSAFTGVRDCRHFDHRSADGDGAGNGIRRAALSFHNSRAVVAQQFRPDLRNYKFVWCRASAHADSAGPGAWLRSFFDGNDFSWRSIFCCCIICFGANWMSFERAGGNCHPLFFCFHRLCFGRSPWLARRIYGITFYSTLAILAAARESRCVQ